MRLGERCASRAACLSCGLCAQLTWASTSNVTCHHGNRRVGPVDHYILAGYGGEPVSAPRPNDPQRQLNFGARPAASFIEKTLTRLDRMKQTRQKEQLG